MVSNNSDTVNVFGDPSTRLLRYQSLCFDYTASVHLTIVGADQVEPRCLSHLFEG